MKILIISDLHFKETTDWTFINNITQSMVGRVKRKIKDYEELLVIILGDIVMAIAFENLIKIPLHSRIY